MKAIFSLFSILFVSLFFGQKISDYKYILVPDSFKDFSENQYQLKQNLVQKLKAKGYTVLAEEKEQWPSEAYQNQCNVATADVQNTSSLFKNKIAVVFNNCNGKTIEKFDGTTFIKEYETGYPDAMGNALKMLAVSSPKAMVTEHLATRIPNTESIPPPPQKAKPINPIKTEKKPVANTEVSSTSDKVYNKIILSNQKFILADSQTNVAVATFIESGKSGVYHIKFQNGMHALGYLENGNAVIEIPQEDGSYLKEIYIVK